MVYTVHQAKTHFSRLLKEAEAGQEVVVMRGKKPIAKPVPINEPPPQQPGSHFRLIGAYRGQTPGIAGKVFQACGVALPPTLRAC